MSPLDGIKVLDLSRVLAGPWATMTLGDLGAEIWKIENPSDGDETRSWSPPEYRGTSTYYLAVNRNKSSLAVDFRTSADKRSYANSPSAPTCSSRTTSPEHWRATASITNLSPHQSAAHLLLLLRLWPHGRVGDARRLRFPHSSRERSYVD